MAWKMIFCQAPWQNIDLTGSGRCPDDPSLAEHPDFDRDWNDIFPLPGNFPEDTIFEGLDDLSACFLMVEDPR